MMQRDRAGRGLVIVGVAIAGSVGMFVLLAAAFSIVTLNQSFQACDSQICVGDGDPALLVLVLGIFVGYVFLLVQMLRGITAALGLGGFIGLLMAVVGFGFVAVKGAEAAIDVVVVLAVLATGGAALALGASLRLVARRAQPPAKPADL